MSIYGCPDPDENVWEYGYINISFTKAVHLYDKGTGQLNWRDPVKLLGPYGSYSLQMNFCTKVSSFATSQTGKWPDGQFLVYGSEKGCPEGTNGFCLLA